MKTFFIAIVVLVFFNSAHGQAVIDTTNQQDTAAVSVQKLLNPSFNQYPEITPLNPFRYDKSIDGVAKSLLKLGTDFIRGENEKYSIYSFENSWRYPGATVKYPQTFTEMELFLKRYKQYDPHQ